MFMNVLCRGRPVPAILDSRKVITPVLVGIFVPVCSACERCEIGSTRAWECSLQMPQSSFPPCWPSPLSLNRKPWPLVVLQMRCSRQKVLVEWARGQRYLRRLSRHLLNGQLSHRLLLRQHRLLRRESRIRMLGTQTVMMMLLPKTSTFSLRLLKHQRVFLRSSEVMLLPPKLPRTWSTIRFRSRPSSQSRRPGPRRRATVEFVGARCQLATRLALRTSSYHHLCNNWDQGLMNDRFSLSTTGT